MKNILGAIGVLIFTIFFLNLSAQVYYYYDNNGNRITSSTHHAPEKRQDSSKIKVYPNPTNGVLNVDLASFGTCGYATIYALVINIHNPQYSLWWKTTSHLQNAYDYNLRWENFFEKLGSPTKEGALQYGRDLMSDYGYKTNY